MSELTFYLAAGGLSVVAGLFAAIVSAKAGGRPFNNRPRLVFIALTGVQSAGFAEATGQGHTYFWLAVWMGGVTAGWVSAYAAITLREYLQEAPMRWFFFRRDFRKNMRKLAKQLHFRPA